MSVVPELKLGFAALWNGAVNEEAVAWDSTPYSSRDQFTRNTTPLCRCPIPLLLPSHSTPHVAAVHEILLPALVSTLSTLQPAPPLPPPSFVSAVVGFWTAVGMKQFSFTSVTFQLYPLFLSLSICIDLCRHADFRRTDLPDWQ